MPILIPTLSLTFDHQIKSHQINRWRGAFNEMAQRSDDLFHNHIGDKTYHYRYPLIQYRCQDGQAGLVAINEGVNAVQRLLSEKDWSIRWNGRHKTLKVVEVVPEDHYLTMTDQPYHYRIHQWLPFNKENYQLWLAAPNYMERIKILEKILVGHLLGFAEAMEWRLPQRLEADIQLVHNMGKVLHHKNNLIGFDLTYSCNIDLPPHIGIGKGVSHGFGWQRQIKE